MNISRLDGIDHRPPAISTTWGKSQCTWFMLFFRIVPERLEDFLVAVKENAATSLAGDYGCRQFDVSLAADGSNDVLLYERYDTAECCDTPDASPLSCLFRP